MTQAETIAILWRITVLLTVVAIGAVRLLVPALLPQMGRAGFVAVNYRGRSVPNAGGMIPVLVSSAALLFWLLMPTQSVQSVTIPATALLLATLGFALVGFIDDAIGDRTAGGLQGHFRRLVRGDVTTGSIKAMFGGLVALAVAVIVSGSFLETVLNTLLIAAVANAVNLFDVRPGRALKLFGLGFALLALLGSTHPVWIVVVPSLAAWVAFAPEDLGGRAMLGDGGANAAGALLGATFAMAAGLVLKAMSVVLLVLLHVATERGSMTDIIGKAPLLRYLDEWGREQDP